MADLNRVLVLAGGLTPEHEVSVRSGRRVADALRRLGVEVQIGDAGSGLVNTLTTDPPQVVFPVLHGTSGEDGAIREVLELSGIPYVGARPEACRIAYAKPIAKTLLAREGVAVPRGLALPKALFHDLGAPAVLERIVAALGLPLFVKPDQGGSAFGASAVATASELPAALVSCFAYSDTALIEEQVSGTEIAVGVLDMGDGPVALPAVEIVPDGGVYDYTARYTAGRTEFFSPARLTPEAAKAAAEAAVTAHRALGLRDVSRTDLIVDDSGRVHFLEVNVSPGMTETSTLPLAVEAAGMDFAIVCRELAHRALLRG
ncbi:D-alanine--D-alanine ligase family protein [Actinorugispora endophytica]|uniref:D-alanine--D-alanine ligase n=1 Tax=Actinorugispora endophytica TaxID=1605990 RepID=A0A4R6VCD7_9ACTN|nr:D-alanine--D-alanine ligase [Actinorugispora endophytica]TDQ54426.1 D-alanine--D-alanine ligase [Actinorugispora endophytica]